MEKEDYDDFLDKEEQKRRIKIANCPHNQEFLIFIKCKSCGLAMGEKDYNHFHEEILKVLKK